MIKAITFDLWDTVFIDDSDEPKRKAANLDSKPIERRNIVHQYLDRISPISRDMVDLAYNTVDAAFRHVWYQQQITWTVEERINVILKGLQRELPKKDFREVVRLHEEMELEIMPDLAIGIRPAIEALHPDFKLAVISDSIFSPGRVLKQILEKYNLLQYFDAFVFSDEVGCAKPDPRVFKTIASELGVELNEIAHIGDRVEKDIDGPHAIGAKGILTTVVINRGGQNSKADIVCNDYSQLLAQITKM